MEDVTNWAMRRLTKRIAGPGLMFTEFVSAMAIHYNAAKTRKKFRIHPEERPLGIQIFGGDPATMVEAALESEAAGADILDINMGCWVPKVCKTGSGAALLKDPDLAERIVHDVVRAVRIPVTVKVRAGWDYGLFAAPDLARRFQGAGAQALTLHARFAKQGFEGEANWKLISQMREAVQIPLIGNGDVKTPEDAHRMFEETGCDGVMVGRAAMGDPWALRRIVESVEGRPISALPSLSERIEACLEHCQLMISYEAGLDAYEPVDAATERRAISALRGLLPLYIKGEFGAAQIRHKLTACSSLAEVEQVLRDFQAHLPVPSLAERS